jgi:hypothetical protein
LYSNALCPRESAGSSMHNGGDRPRERVDIEGADEAQRHRYGVRGTAGLECDRASQCIDCGGQLAKCAKRIT